jgi:hypothetical protein
MCDIGEGIKMEAKTLNRIIMESEKWSVATVLVVIGVATEAIFTIILFRFDEGISLEQQAKIIELEKNLAGLYENDKQRQLKPEQVSAIVDALRIKYHTSTSSGPKTQNHPNLL